jgi:hypothetical protein
VTSQELRQGEWLCNCPSNPIRSKSCLRCLRCGAQAPDPVTLGRACFAIGVYQKAISLGKTPVEAMQEALQEDAHRRGNR